MKNGTVVLLAWLLAIATAPGAWAQSGAKGTLGILSPAGTFRPVSTAPLSSAALTAKRTVSGMFTVELAITIRSAIPVSTPILCGLNASVFGSNADVSVTDSIQESASALAVRSGATATCSLKLPYLWTLFTSNDTVTLSFSITASGTSGAGRTSNIQFDIISVPKAGATTAYSLTARI